MVLRLIRALPGEAAFLAPRCWRKTPANVAPGSRRQDHTTSPSAAGAFVRCKTPDAAAAIASPTQRIVTIAKRPLRRAGMRLDTVNPNSGKAKYFRSRDLTASW